MAEKLTSTREDLTYEPGLHDGSDLWTDEESEEIVTVTKTCAYDPLTRL
jgi:hypothetical protein